MRPIPALATCAGARRAALDPQFCLSLPGVRPGASTAPHKNVGRINRHAEERARDPRDHLADPVRRRGPHRAVQLERDKRGAHRVQRVHRRAAANGDGRGPAHFGPAHAVLPRPHQRARPSWPERQQRHRAESRCASARARRGQPSREGQGHRSARRDPGAAQRQHRHRRQDADHGRIARAHGQACPSRLDGRRQPARGRRGHPRQDEPLGVGKLPLLLLHERLVRPRGPDP